MKKADLVEFFRLMNPIIHEPLGTKVAEEWADRFLERFAKHETRWSETGPYSDQELQERYVITTTWEEKP